MGYSKKVKPPPSNENIDNGYDSYEKMNHDGIITQYFISHSIQTRQTSDLRYSGYTPRLFVDIGFL